MKGNYEYLKFKQESRKVTDHDILNRVEEKPKYKMQPVKFKLGDTVYHLSDKDEIDHFKVEEIKIRLIQDKAHVTYYDHTRKLIYHENELLFGSMVELSAYYLNNRK